MNCIIRFCCVNNSIAFHVHFKSNRFYNKQTDEYYMYAVEGNVVSWVTKK